MMVSAYFSREEFACKCGCGFDTVDSMLLEALNTIRSHFGRPVTVTSGCRCEEYNDTIGGSVNSQHKKGRAADIVVRDASPKAVADFAEDLGMSVGRYETFTHIDSRTGPPARWGHN